jgi:hypothetical protein
MSRVFPCQLLLAALILARAVAADQPQASAGADADGRDHPIRSIAVLPPINQTRHIDATYNCLSTVTKPLAELGYYVFPVAVIDQYLKANGMPTPGEMHQVPLTKVAEIIGADAVLYLEVTEYTGRKVTVSGRLVDTRNLTVLWENSATAVDYSSDSLPSDGEPPHNTREVLADVVLDVVSVMIDDALDDSLGGTPVGPDLCGLANKQLLDPKVGPPYGPYSPAYGMN